MDDATIVTKTATEKASQLRVFLPKEKRPFRTVPSKSGSRNDFKITGIASAIQFEETNLTRPNSATRTKLRNQRTPRSTISLLKLKPTPEEPGRSSKFCEIPSLEASGILRITLRKIRIVCRLFSGTTFSEHLSFRTQIPSRSQIQIFLQQRLSMGLCRRFA